MHKKKTKIKSLLSKEINFNNKKQRLKLYDRTFRKNKVESQLFTFQREALQLSMSLQAFALNPNDSNYKKLAENIGDNEVMIESLKNTFPQLYDNINSIKFEKLKRLKERTDEQDEEEKLAAEQKQAPETEEEIAEEKLDEAKKELDEAIEKENLRIVGKYGEATNNKKKLSFWQKLNPWNYWP